MNVSKNVIINKMIEDGGLGYFLKSTPFPEGNEYNYDDELKEDFFWKYLYSEQEKTRKKFEEVRANIENKMKKTIILLGYQGCGKTTFVNALKRNIDAEIDIAEMDTDLSNPPLEPFVEKYANILHQRFIKSNSEELKKYYELYEANKEIIFQCFGADNRIGKLMNDYRYVFLSKTNIDTKKNFLTNISRLFFGQILCLIILWDIMKFTVAKQIYNKVYCMDNVDILVSTNNIESFFDQYFKYVRSIDKVIQKLSIKTIADRKLTYSSTFTFIICTRESTWSKIISGHLNDSVFDTTDPIDISEAYYKAYIIDRRTNYILSKRDDFSPVFVEKNHKIKEVFRELREQKNRNRNIFDLFNNDYRRCVTCINRLLKEKEDIFLEYFNMKKLCDQNMKQFLMYGARGIIYRGIWDIFKKQDLFEKIGVLDVDINSVAFSNSRLILTYLSKYTSSNIDNSNISLTNMYKDFKGVISKREINRCLCNMYNIRKGTSWNHLVSFTNINIGEDDELNCMILEKCDEQSLDILPIKVYITRAGEEYLDLMTTHFEFFSCRVKKKNENIYPLFHSKNKTKFLINKEVKYRFQITIENVIDIIRNCAQKLHNFYEECMFKKYKNKERYLESHFNYQPSNGNRVFHGERIIHTHIRYLDDFRLYMMLDDNIEIDEKVKINRILVGYIEEYIKIGEKYTNILSNTSVEILFPDFKNAIKTITISKFTDFVTEINEVSQVCDLF